MLLLDKMNVHLQNASYIMNTHLQNESFSNLQFECTEHQQLAPHAKCNRASGSPRGVKSKDHRITNRRGGRERERERVRERERRESERERGRGRRRGREAGK